MNIMRMSSLVIVGLVAFGSGLVVAASQDALPPWNVPEDARAVPNPVEKTPEALAAGAALFKKHCVMCHGDAGKGDGPATQFMKPTPPDISTPEAKARLTDGEIFYKITHGKRPMPPTDKKMSETERWEVVLHVRELQGN